MTKSFRFLFLLLFFCCFLVNGQVKGIVTNDQGVALPFVNIYILDTYIGTTSNENGLYELQVEKENDYMIVFQYLGYKTVRKKIKVDQFPLELNVKMVPENMLLNEVTINAKDNPANDIIKKVISFRKKNLQKTDTYTSDFYSRGIYRLKDAPERILGQNLGDFGGGLDSTRSGVIYLSETKSKIFRKAPSLFKEKIMASKVSGNDNAFSFNNASDVNFSFYQNTIEFNTSLISPISDYAFNYYTYRLESTFYDDLNNLIYKIKATPKRPKDRVGEGFLYIVKDQWALYAVEFALTGEQLQLPAVEKIVLKLNYSYSEKDTLWALISQTFDVAFGIFGIKGNGRFTAVYNNYNFNPDFDTTFFTNEIVSFEKSANKKEDDFWSKVRPVPLTNEEATDYSVKDSIKTIRKSKKYLDSLDQKNNRFKATNFFFGYTYKNSYKDWQLTFNAPLFATQYNSIQGWNSTAGITYFKNNEEKGSWLRINTDLNYGFSDKRLRASGRISYKLNNFTKPLLIIEGGSKLQQFNPSNPISPSINTIASIAFNNNFLKAYEKTYITFSYSEEFFNGLRFFTNLSYEDRKPLFNSEFNDDFTSNNPLLPESFFIPAFEAHTIVKASITARIRFGQKYLSYPNAKYNLINDDYPSLYLAYEAGLASNNTINNFSQLRARITQNFNIANKGRFVYNLKAGTFFSANNISFPDFQHFNGNQTRIGTESDYTNRFNLLPYYALSTNSSYLEAHAEHNFQGYILGKIPGLRQLNFNLVLGAHTLGTKNNKPYSEYSIGMDNIGWGKFRWFRMDYVRSYQNGFQGDGVIFGLKVIDIFN
ncbi:DUF5686 and carboxypeptidase regulatory-like domain-containing protein [Ascidiimonas sp. W6]|uniref:DUF5686 and carboxypeptidase regulatory-like domain-containing protein n=1 Tax=Ascidiimonas meishanensis TaxID=3128903 RepID=UPI0030EE3CBE